MGDIERVGNSKSFFIALIKGVFVALLISLVAILIFALFLKFVDINDGWIKPINQVIKVVSIFFGVRAFLKICGNKGMCKGVALGALYTMLAFVIFSLLSSSFSFDLTLLYDVLFGCVIGGICGIICNSIRN